MAVVETFGITSPLKIFNYLNDNAVPTYFSRVEFVDDENGTYINCFEPSGELFIKLTFASTENSTIIYKGANQTGAESVPTYDWFGSTNVNIGYAAKCDGGILIVTDWTSLNSEKYVSMIITKNQRGKCACIMTNSSNPGSSGADIPNLLMRNVHAVSFGDNVDANKLRNIYCVSQNQTQFVPFPTYSNQGEVSYTPNALYMQTGVYYGMRYGQFMSDNNIYITNGYWVVKDSAIAFSS